MGQNTLISVGLLDRYIGRNVFFSTLLVLFLLFLLLFFIVFVDGMGDVGRAHFGLYELFRYTLLSQPKGIYQLFPTAALLGSILGLSSLAAGSELVAFRAAGVSLWRISWAVIKTGAIFVVAGILIGEYVVPVAEEAAQRGRAQALGTGFRTPGTGLWLRNGSEYVNIGEVLPDSSLLNVSISRFDEQQNLQQQLNAKRGRFVGEYWQLYDVEQSFISTEEVRFKRIDKIRWSSAISPEAMAVYMVKPEALSLYRLRQYLEHLRSNGQQTNRYELEFWRKVFSPFAIVVMLLLAIPFVFAQPRSGALGYQVFIGVMVALVFNMVNYGLGHSASVFGIPAFLGAVSPPTLFLVLAIVLIRRAS